MKHGIVVNRLAASTQPVSSTNFKVTLSIPMTDLAGTYVIEAVGRGAGGLLRIDSTLATIVNP